MNVAELVVNLVFKGGDQAGKSLKTVKTGLGEVKSMSLEAKAAIVGAVYALERLMSQSAQRGTDLVNFNALTGLSAKQLQQWQWAAQQAGVKGQEFEGSLKGVQQRMSDMLMGKGAPEGMAMLANKVGFDPARARDTFYVMEQLQKFARTVPADIGNRMIQSFGVSEGTIAAMRRNAFRDDVFKRAPTYSDGETKQLSRVDVAWSNLGTKIQMAMGHLTAKHGLKLVKDISGLADAILKAADALTTLAEKTQALSILGEVFKGWGEIFGVIGSAADKLSELAGADKDEKGKVKGNLISNTSNWVGKKIDDFFDDKDFLEYGISKPKLNGLGASEKNTTVNQTLNFQHDGKDHKRTGESVKKAVKDAFRQSSAQGQGS